VTDSIRVVIVSGDFVSTGVVVSTGGFVSAVDGLAAGYSGDSSNIAKSALNRRILKIKLIKVNE